MIRFLNIRCPARRRRGAVDPVSIAAASLLITAVSLGTHFHRNMESSEALDNFLNHSTEVADGMSRILEQKYERMRQSGQLTEAEYARATHRMNRRSTHELLQQVSRQLGNRQAQLLQTELNNSLWSAFWTAVSAGAGEAVKKSNKVKAAVQKFLQLTEKKAGMAINAVSSTHTLWGYLESGFDSSNLVSPEEIGAALAQAEQRIHGGVDPGSMADDPDVDVRVLLPQRISAFFEKWSRNNNIRQYIEAPNQENWVRRYRTPREKHCHAAFEQFIQNDLAGQGWEVPAAGLHATAWQILRSLPNYRRTFGRDYSGTYQFAATSVMGSGQTNYQIRFKDNRDGTATATFQMPPGVDLRPLQAFGLPIAQEYHFPLTAEIDRSRSCESSFYTDGREIHAVVKAFSKMQVLFGEGPSDFFGSKAALLALAERADAKDCVLTFTPVSETSLDLTLSFSGTMIVPGRKNGRMVVEEKEKELEAVAKRIQ